MPEELAALDQLVDADDLLLDDAARPHVEVADLRRALIAGPQADVATGGAEHRMRIGRQEMLQDGWARQRDGVARVLAADPPAVADDQHDRSWHGRSFNRWAPAAVHFVATYARHVILV